MAGTFTVSGANITVNFTYTALTSKIQSAVSLAAEYAWNHGYGDHGTEESPILFSDLTNQEKLNIVDSYVKTHILDAAKAQNVTNDVKTARENAISEADTINSLG